MNHRTLMLDLFNEDMEATFLSPWDAARTAAWLEDHGFSRDKAFDDFMNPPGEQAPPSPEPGH